MAQFDTHFDSYKRTRSNHWDAVACQMDSWKGWSGEYNERLTQVYRFWVASGQRILEIGCGQGNLLASLHPLRGVGVDFSPEMVKRARIAHPELEFFEADSHDLSLLAGPFDIIILSDLINDLWDVQKVFEQLSSLCQPRTRLIINSYSRVWELPLLIAAKLGLAKPRLTQNWLTVEDVTDLLNLSGFEVIRSWQEILWPLWTPGIAFLCNKILAKLWPFRLFAMTNFILARPCPEKNLKTPIVSVIVAARNEAGNIASLFARIPEMGSGTELIFVEGHSNDDTYCTIEREIAAHPEKKTQLHQQSGTGKGDAVRLGFAAAKGDILMILDADMTVQPEDLPRFYEALHSGR